MFAYLEGKLAEVTPTYAVVDCAGVGYEVNISVQTYSKIKEMSQVKLWIKQIVREDANVLYGFYETREKNLFLLLITVPGVGAATARVILSTLNVDQIANAILNDDVKSIQAIKGIGAKTAQRIIIDLKDKVKWEEYVPSLEEGVGMGMSVENPCREEALAALTMLGFAKTNTEKVLNKILLEEKDLNTESLIKRALRML